MKAPKNKPTVRRAPAGLPARPRLRPARAGEFERLRERLAVAEQTLRAIRHGEVDTLVVSGKHGSRLFTLQGAEHPYRVLIESMNEGALTLTSDMMILYANQRFAHTVKTPLERVIGGSLRRYLAPADWATLRPLLHRPRTSGTKIQAQLRAADSSQVPVQISIRRLVETGITSVSFGLVVTDMTEARRTEEMLRALTQRVVQVQEAERERIYLELHDHISQMLIAGLFRSQALADSLAARNGPAKMEARKLRELLDQMVWEVQRISHSLRPDILDQLGLVAALRSTGAEFSDRTGVRIRFTGPGPTARLPADIELALYRIFQEALKNVEQHARARRVTVYQAELGGHFLLTVKDDGIGFDSIHHAVRRKGQGILGLVGMRERAAAVGGLLMVKSGRGAGTEIEVRVPLPTREAAA